MSFSTTEVVCDTGVLLNAVLDTFPANKAAIVYYVSYGNKSRLNSSTMVCWFLKTGIFHIATLLLSSAHRSHIWRTLWSSCLIRSSKAGSILVLPYPLMRSFSFTSIEVLSEDCKCLYIIVEQIKTYNYGLRILLFLIGALFITSCWEIKSLAHWLLHFPKVTTESLPMANQEKRSNCLELMCIHTWCMSYEHIFMTIGGSFPRPMLVSKTDGRYLKGWEKKNIYQLYS